MCRPKEKGGRRCPAHSPASRRTGRAAARLYGSDTAINRVAVESLPAEYVHGTISERAHIAATTTDQEVMKLAARDPKFSVVDALTENPNREDIRIVHQEPEEGEEVTKRLPAVTSVDENQFARTLTINAGNGSTADVEIPAGHLHISELKARGWTPEMLKEHLGDDAVLMEDAHVNISPKIYPVDAVTDAESKAEVLAELGDSVTAKEEVARVKAEARAAEDARIAAQMPRMAPEEYALSNCVGKKYLKKRGWTDGHIDRLLGDPDAYTSSYKYPGEAQLWGRERVTQAEAEDANPKFQKRLTQAAENNAAVKAAENAELQKQISQAAEKKAGVKAAEIAEAVNSGGVVFVRSDSEDWNLRGKNLHPGQTVTVTRRDGTTSERVVTSVLETDAAGVVTARSIPNVPQQTSKPGTPRTGPHIREGICLDCEENEDTGDMNGCEWHRKTDSGGFSQFELGHWGDQYG